MRFMCHSIHFSDINQPVRSRDFLALLWNPINMPLCKLFAEQFKGTSKAHARFVQPDSGCCNLLSYQVQQVECPVARLVLHRCRSPPHGDEDWGCEVETTARSRSTTLGGSADNYSRHHIHNLLRLQELRVPGVPRGDARYEVTAGESYFVQGKNLWNVCLYCTDTSYGDEWWPGCCTVLFDDKYSLSWLIREHVKLNSQ